MPQIKMNISFGLVNCPVGLDAAAREDKVSFNQVAPDGGGVSQKITSKKTGEPVAKSDCRKGIELADGSYAVIEDSELEALAPKSSQIIEIESFVPAGTVDPKYFNTSYYLSPGKTGDKPYALIYKTILDSGKYAVAKATLYGRETVVIIRACSGGLMLHRCHFDSEVRDTRSFRADVSNLDVKELKLAAMLVDGMTEASFDASKYEDTHTAALRRLIAAKTSGAPTSATQAATPAPDLMEQIRLSIATANAKKVVAKPEVRKPMASADPNLGSMLDQIAAHMDAQVAV